MKIDREEIVHTIKNTFPLTLLPKIDVNKLVERSETLHFPDQKMVYTHGSSADFFYIVIRGKVEELVEMNYSLIRVNCIQRCGLFGWEALKNHAIRGTSARAISDAIVIKIKRKVLLTIFQNDRTTMEYCKLISRNISNECTVREKNTSMCETNYLIQLPHTIKYVFRITPVFFLGLFGLLFWLTSAGGAGRISAWWLISTLILAVGWTLVQYFEWKNDYFLITSDRLMFRQSRILSKDRQQEIPLQKIESIGRQTGLLGRRFGYGDVVISTLNHQMVLPFIKSPGIVVQLIEYIILQLKKMEQQARFEDITSTLNHRLGRDSVQIDREDHQDREENPTGLTPNGENESARKIEFDAETIQYHTHWTILFSKIIFPTLLMMSLGGFYVFTRGNNWVVVEKGIILWLIIGTSIFLMMWWLYQYMDWRNDVYIISDEKIIDVNRKPLGKEEKKTAPLEKIQSVEFRRNGVLGLLFNFGTVFLNVGDSTFTFDYVHRPAEVQQEVFSRIEKRRIVNQANSLEKQQENTLEWITAYHRISGKEKDTK